MRLNYKMLVTVNEELQDLQKDLQLTKTFDRDGEDAVMKELYENVGMKYRTKSDDATVQADSSLNPKRLLGFAGDFFKKFKFSIGGGSSPPAPPVAQTTSSPPPASPPPAPPVAQTTSSPPPASVPEEAEDFVISDYKITFSEAKRLFEILYGIAESSEGSIKDFFNENDKLREYWEDGLTTKSGYTRQLDSQETRGLADVIEIDTCSQTDTDTQPLWEELLCMYKSNQDSLEFRHENGEFVIEELFCKFEEWFADNGKQDDDFVTQYRSNAVDQDHFFISRPQNFMPFKKSKGGGYDQDVYKDGQAKKQAGAPMRIWYNYADIDRATIETDLKEVKVQMQKVFQKVKKKTAPILGKLLSGKERSWLYLRGYILQLRAKLPDSPTPLQSKLHAFGHLFMSEDGTIMNRMSSDWKRFHNVLVSPDQIPLDNFSRENAFDGAIGSFYQLIDELTERVGNDDREKTLKQLNLWASVLDA